MSVEWKTSYQKIDYLEAVTFMENRVEQIYQGKEPELVWCLEHPPVYTAGTSALDEELINAGNIPVYNTGRGGKYTYHGPGQRVVYLMLNLKSRGQDLRKYVANLEDWVIDSLKEIGIIAEKKAGRIGIWTYSSSGKEVKVAAIGIRVRKWISYHGVAINVFPDLECYDGIVACGIKEFGVTSLQELGCNISYERLDQILKDKFSAFF